MDRKEIIKRQAALLHQESAADRIARHEVSHKYAMDNNHPDPFVQYLYDTGVDVTHRWSDFQKILEMDKE